MKEISEFTQRVVNRDLMRWPALSWITRRINIVLFMLIRICTYIYILIDAVAWQQSMKEKIIVKREKKKCKVQPLCQLYPRQQHYLPWLEVARYTFAIAR